MPLSEVESNAVIFGGVTEANLPQDLKNSRRSSSSGEDIAAPKISRNNYESVRELRNSFTKCVSEIGALRVNGCQRLLRAANPAQRSQADGARPTVDVRHGPIGDLIQMASKACYRMITAVVGYCSLPSGLQKSRLLISSSISLRALRISGPSMSSSGELKALHDRQLSLRRRSSPAFHRRLPFP